jgi:hypothetical protein
MFAMKNFVMPTDPHATHAKANDAPTVVFKTKKEKNEVPKLKAEKATEQAPKPMKEVSEPPKPRVAEAQEKSIPVEKRAEVAKVGGSKGPKKIRFEKGSAEAVEWGKEMSLRRKLKKEGSMKEKVVEVKPMTETIIAESVKVPVAVA